MLYDVFSISNAIKSILSYNDDQTEKLNLESNNLINNIQSEELRNVADYLLQKGAQITFFGVAWSNANGNWIYFNVKLDLVGLRKKFNLSPDIVAHVNKDPKSGTEAGFIDQRTGEGLMGVL